MHQNIIAWLCISQECTQEFTSVGLQWVLFIINIPHKSLKTDIENNTCTHIRHQNTNKKSPIIIICFLNELKSEWNSRQMQYSVGTAQQLNGVVVNCAGYSGPDRSHLPRQRVAGRRKSGIPHQHSSLSGNRCARGRSRAGHATVHEARHHRQSGARDHRRSDWRSPHSPVEAVGHLHRSTILGSASRRPPA